MATPPSLRSTVEPVAGQLLLNAAAGRLFPIDDALPLPSLSPGAMETPLLSAMAVAAVSHSAPSSTAAAALVKQEEKLPEQLQLQLQLQQQQPGDERGQQQEGEHPRPHKEVGSYPDAVRRTSPSRQERSA